MANQSIKSGTYEWSIDRVVGEQILCRMRIHERESIFLIQTECLSRLDKHEVKSD